MSTVDYAGSVSPNMRRRFATMRSIAMMVDCSRAKKEGIQHGNVARRFSLPVSSQIHDG